jgi:hypothetical protein
MQVTAEYVERVLDTNVIPMGYKYTVIIISVIKRTLAQDIPPEYRLKFLNQLDAMTSSGQEGYAWLTADMIAAIDPMCDRGDEMFSEASKLDRGRPGQPAMFDALNKFFPAFAVLNPSLMTALEMEPRRSGYFRPEISGGSQQREITR